MTEIYLRPLEENDALVSYNWRNNPEIWKYTGGKPDRIITKEIELTWIKEAIQRDHEKRFAICIKKNSQYIGNVQLTHITSTAAQFHIFIGESSFWGQKIGTSATKLIMKLAFNELKLDSLYLYVKKNNLAAIKAYLNSGFKKIPSDNEMIKMAVEKNDC